MASITVKNIPDALYARLKRSAEINRRSLNVRSLRALSRLSGATR